MVIGDNEQDIGLISLGHDLTFFVQHSAIASQDTPAVDFPFLNDDGLRNRSRWKEHSRCTSASSNLFLKNVQGFMGLKRIL